MPAEIEDTVRAIGGLQSGMVPVASFTSAAAELVVPAPNLLSTRHPDMDLSFVVGDQA